MIDDKFAQLKPIIWEADPGPRTRIFLQPILKFKLIRRILGKIWPNPKARIYSLPEIKRSEGELRVTGAALSELEWALDCGS